MFLKNENKNQIIKGCMTTDVFWNNDAIPTNLIDKFMGSLKKGQKYIMVYGVQLIRIEAVSNRA